MKKFFFLAVAACAAMTMNAKTWEFSKDTLSTVAAVNSYAETNTFTLQEKTASEGATYVAVDYKATAEVAVLDLVTAPIHIKFEYKNSGDKTEVFKFYNSYLQMARKGAKMTIYCKAGDPIKLAYKSYSKATEFAVTGADKTTVATVKDEEGVIELVASADEVLLDTSNPSDGTAYAQACQFTSLEVGTASAVENVKVSAPAQKYIENGMLIIIKDGVRYNALGAKL